jgi:hypothetical protein
MRALLSSALAAALVLPALAQAAPISASIATDGTIAAVGGGPTADGDYLMAFAIYTSATGGTAVWSEAPAAVPVQGGRFRVPLGLKTPLTPEVLGGPAGERWLGITVGSDPELPRTPLRAVPYARTAELAGALACSGCVTAAQLDPAVLKDYAKTSDLAGYAAVNKLAKVATSGAYGDLVGTPNLSVYAKLDALAAVAVSGSYKDLKDAPKLADVALTGLFGDLAGLPNALKAGSSCGTGLVVQGIGADGSWVCTKMGDANSLPADGLATVSNGLLTNQFADNYASSGSPGIPDNNPVGVSDTITVPDVGIAQSLTVNIDVANSDVSALTVKLTDPAGGS